MKKLKVSKATDQREGHIIKTSKSCPWPMVCISSDQVVSIAFKTKWGGQAKK